MKTRRIAAIAALLVLSACSTSPKYFWTGGGDQAAAEKQLEIDDARCTAVSHGAAPMPQIQQTQLPAAYTHSGEVRSTTPGQWPPQTYSYNGTSTPVISPSSAFATGFANGANIGAAIAAGQTRQKIYHGCMLNLGWSTVPPVAKTPQHSAPKEAESPRLANEKWEQAIQTFMDIEAASTDGIDYRNDKAKLQLLDVTVRGLANDPGNSDKSMSWFLIEANKMVKNAYKAAQ